MNARLPDQQYVLPANVIDRLFARLEAAYGSRWMNMWGNTALSNVKALWAEKLGGFHENLGAIGYALDALDEHPFPPTLPEFLALCRKAPRPSLPALPQPEASPEKAAAFANEVKSVTSQKKDLLAWARKPKSLLAWNALLDLAKTDRSFTEIVEQLTSAGHVANGHPVHCWDGISWIKA